MSTALLTLSFVLGVGLLLGLVGGGGPIVAVPVLVYVLGQPVEQATTASLLVVGSAALVGALDHARIGRVQVKTAVGFGAAGAIGAVAGTSLNRVADEQVPLLAFALLLLAAAADGGSAAPTRWRSAASCHSRAWPPSESAPES